MQNLIKIRHLKLPRKIKDFNRFWALFSDTVGSILAWRPKADPNSITFFDAFFIEFLYATGARRVRGVVASMVKTARWPPGAAPFLSKKGSYNDPRNALDCFLAFLPLEAGWQDHFARDLTRPGPLARRIRTHCALFVRTRCAFLREPCAHFI